MFSTYSLIQIVWMFLFCCFDLPIWLSLYLLKDERKLEIVYFYHQLPVHWHHMTVSLNSTRAELAQRNIQRFFGFRGTVLTVALARVSKHMYTITHVNRVFPKWSRAFIKFGEFSEFKESEKSLKHEYSMKHTYVKIENNDFLTSHATVWDNRSLYQFA